jgi:hypothetical protein
MTTLTTSKYKHPLILIPESLRIDYIFSYWILFVFVLYELGINPYNPKLLILAGLIENVGSIALLLFYRVSWITIGLFILNTILIKGIPLLLVWKDKIQAKDIYFSIGVFVLYNLWMQYNQIHIFQFYEKIMDSVINERNETPFFWAIHRLFG